MSKTYGYLLTVFVQTLFVKIPKFRDTESRKLLTVTSQLDIQRFCYLSNCTKIQPISPIKFYVCTAFLCVLFIISFQCNVNFQFQILAFSPKDW